MLPHRSHFIVFGCIAFLFGVGFACVHPLGLVAGVAMVVGGVVVAATHPREIALLGCVLACFGLGAVRVSVLPVNSVPDGTKVDGISATIIREPQLLQDAQRLVLELADSNHTVVQTEAALQPRYMIDDEVQLTCTLTRAKASSDFAYDKYLERYGISALCQRPTVVFVGAHRTLRRTILDIKQHAKSAVQRLLPLPEQGIVLGTVFGVDHQLPKYVEDAFRTTGTTHLLVISGSQIVLIVGVCTQLLQRTPLRRRGVMLVIVGLLFCYATMTGWQASVLRAALCACVVFGVELLGRTSGGVRILLYAATLMVAQNPYVLLYDAGFQLSFLATAGILCFASRIDKRLQWMPETGGIRSAAATSMAAMIPTSPLIAYSFHTFSPVSLFANMVAVPISGFLTIGGFGFSIIAAIAPPLAKLLAPALFTLAHIFLSIVTWFSTLPYASINFS